MRYICAYIILFMCMCSVVVAAPLIRGSEKMRGNRTVQVQEIVGGDDKQNGSVVISVFFVLLIVVVALFILYVKVKYGSRRSV